MSRNDQDKPGRNQHEKMKTDAAKIAELRAALGTLVNEAKHFSNTGLGIGFLKDAIAAADLTLNDIPKVAGSNAVLLVTKENVLDHGRFTHRVIASDINFNMDHPPMSLETNLGNFTPFQLRSAGQDAIVYVQPATGLVLRVVTQ